MISQVEVRRIIVIITNFLDETVQCTKNQIEDLIWGSNNVTHHFKSLKKTYEVNSFGKVSFSKNNESKSEVYGPYTIPLYLSKETSCRPEIWSQMTMELVKKDGIDLKDYDHLIFVLPASSKIHSKLCGWNGLGHFGCSNRCKAWVSNCDSLGVYVHEIGHNLELRHASYYNALLDEHVEYGDPTAIMSNRWFHSEPDDVFYINAPHRIDKGWIEMDHVLDVNTSGIYKITPFNEPPIDGKYQVIRIKTQETINRYSHYVLSYAVGENVIFNGSCLIHKHTNSKSNTKFLHRLSFESSTVWRDYDNMFSVRLINSTYEEMTLNITFDCIRSDFRVNVLKSDQYTLLPRNIFSSSPILSSSVQYMYANRKKDTNIQLEITNQDTESCHPILLNHETNYLNDRKFTCTPSDLYLRPQQTCIIECNVKPSKTGNDFPTYDFGILFKESPTLLSNYSREFNFNLTLLADDKCWRGGIDFEVPESIESTVSDKFISQITIINYDSKPCSPRKLNMSVYFEKKGKVSYIERDVKINLRPQERKNLTYPTSIPNESGEWNMIFKISDLSNIEERNLEDNVEVKVPAIIYDNCLRSSFNITYPSRATIDARNGTRFIFTIENKDSIMCEPDNIMIKVVGINNTNVQISVFPSQIYNFTSGDIQEAYVTVSTANYIPSIEEASFDIEIYGEKYHIRKQTHKINLQLNPILCEINEPVFSMHCPKYIGLNNDTSTRSQSLGYFKCQIYLKNTNTWPCPTSKYLLSSDFSILTHDDRIIDKGLFNHTLDTDNYELIPSNHTWISLHMEFNKTIIHDYILESPITVNVNISLNDSIIPDVYMNASSTTEIGICKMGEPQIYFDNNITEMTMYAGSSKNLPLNLYINNNKYCKSSSFKVEILNPYKYLRTSLSSSTFERDRKKILMHVVADPLAVGPYTISITSYSSINSSISTSMNITINVDQSCIIFPPSIKPTEKVFQITQGYEGEVIMPVSIMNNDIQGCPASSLKVKMSISHKFINITSKDNFKFELNPLDSIDFNVSISVSRYLEPGNYSIKLETTDSSEISHITESFITLEVRCPQPRPVHGIKLKEVTSPLGTSVRIHLSWESCEVLTDCCCPCTWEIWNHDKLIGRTNYRNFTYVPALSQVGMNNVFTIHVIDRLGQRSNENTCGYSIEKFVASSPFDFLLVIISIFMVLTIPTISFIIEYKKNSYKKVKKILSNS